MYNKKHFGKLMLLSILLMWFWFCYVSADQINSISDILWIFWKPIVNIYFWDHWNSFGWWWLITWSGSSAGPYIISAWSDEYACDEEIHGRYYNIERWERARPLSQNMDLGARDNTDGLTTLWWIYTRCKKNSIWWESFDDRLAACNEITDDIERDSCLKQANADYVLDDSYYWMVTHTYQWKNYALVAWVEYSKMGNWWISIKENSNLSPTLVSVSDSDPMWFLYDYEWWLWMSDCVCSSQSSLDGIIARLWAWEWFNSMIVMEQDEDWDTKLKWDTAYGDCGCWEDAIWIGGSVLDLVIEWLIWRSRSDFWKDSSPDPKTQVFSSVSVNNATLINFTKQKAEALCRWKWKLNTPLVTTTDNVVCIEFSEYSPANVVDASSYKNSKKTLVVKNWDVKVYPVANESEVNDGKQYDVFIDNWNLLIEEYWAEIFVFNNAWFISNKSIIEFEDAVREANENGFTYTWSDAVAVWSLLKWNFIVWWYVKWLWENDVLNNKYFLYGKFTSRDSYNWLKDVFTRSCNWNEWSDWRLCPTCIYNDCPKESRNYYTNAPLVVIDQNYNSPLFW